MRDDIVYWIALSRVDGVGPKVIRALLDRFGDPRAVLEASPPEWKRVKRVGQALAERLGQAGDNLDEIRAEVEMLRAHDVALLTWEDDSYPASLLGIDSPPPVLYMRGALCLPEEPTVAIVGSRHCSEESYKLAQSLAEALAERGVIIVSGMAAGIDGAAHRGALSARGRTIGVLGSGIANIFPPEHVELAEQVVDRGALLSELEPNARAGAATLMARNRIVSGLSRGVIVVEATTRSGTMETVATAERQGRSLWAVSWSGPDDRYSGNRAMLRGGAEAIEPESFGDQVEKIIAALESYQFPPPPPPPERQPTLF